MYKNVFNMEFKTTSTKVVFYCFFFPISLRNFASKCFANGKEDLVGTKLQILVLAGVLK